MRTTVILLLTFALAGAASLDGQTPNGAPADQWRQFRGSAHLAGVSAATPPATLKLLWTYDTGEVIDSSAAIVDGVVYVGGGDGDLIALDLESGALRWTYATGNLIGESSPAVGPDTVYIGDLGGIVHAVDTRDGWRPLRPRPPPVASSPGRRTAGQGRARDPGRPLRTGPRRPGDPSTAPSAASSTPGCPRPTPASYGTCPPPELTPGKWPIWPHAARFLPSPPGRKWTPPGARITSDIRSYKNHFITFDNNYGRVEL